MSIDQLKPETTIQSIIGRVIVKIRKELGVEQGEMSNAVGVTQSTWSKIERGESALSVEQLIMAAGVLNINASVILSEAERAIKALKDQGVQVSRMKAPSAKKSGSGAAMIGAAALGALVTAAIMKNSDN
jgi:transcriptional regulator with XRE-family HTH domain